MKFLSRFPKSLYDFTKYNDFRKTSMLSSIMYLVILSIILGLFIALKPIKMANDYQKLVDKVISTDVNELGIENGKLVVNNEEKINKVETDGSVFFGIDTTNNSSTDNFIGQTGMILYEDKVKGRMNNLTTDVNEEFSIDYSASPFINNIGRDIGLETLKSISKAIKIVFFIESPIVIFIEYLILSVIFAFIASIICKGTKINLLFKERFKIAIYASTIIIVIRSLAAFIGFNIPFLVLAVIHVIYISKAIKQIKLQEGNTAQN